MTDDWTEYESGPFCRHWGDPADCDIKCASCGHGCIDHGFGEGEFDCRECDCEEWKEPE